ncbi:MAG: hypothetical protein GPOALKHO_000348 [Sodalis sp.]|nr:MAG: hypothetical protein GPOALKHO_000348 [Sodalis sp.]
MYIRLASAIDGGGVMFAAGLNIEIDDFLALSPAILFRAITAAAGEWIALVGQRRSQCTVHPYRFRYCIGLFIEQLIQIAVGDITD